jgi:hypothetical protein
LQNAESANCKTSLIIEIMQIGMITCFTILSAESRFWLIAFLACIPIIIYLCFIVDKSKLPKIPKLKLPTFSFEWTSGSFSQSNDEEETKTNWRRILVSILFLAALAVLFTVSWKVTKNYYDWNVKGELKIDGVDTTYLVIKKINDNMMECNVGNYYTIDLKKVSARDTLQFKPGEYVIEDFGKSYDSALFSLKDIITRFKLSDNYKIYIKGSADMLDNDTFVGYKKPAFPYNNYKYHPAILKNGEVFSCEFNSEILSDTILNKDLPKWRGNFILEEFKKSKSGINPPELLQGRVEKRFSTKDMSALIFLYLKDGPWVASKGNIIYIAISLPVSLALGLTLILGRRRRKKKRNKR